MSCSLATIVGCDNQKEFIKKPEAGLPNYFYLDIGRFIGKKIIVTVDRERIYEGKPYDENKQRTNTGLGPSKIIKYGSKSHTVNLSIQLPLEDIHFTETIDLRKGSAISVGFDNDKIYIVQNNRFFYD